MPCTAQQSIAHCTGATTDSTGDQKHQQICRPSQPSTLDKKRHKIQMQPSTNKETLLPATDHEDSSATLKLQARRALAAS